MWFLFSFSYRFFWIHQFPYEIIQDFLFVLELSRFVLCLLGGIHTKTRFFHQNFQISRFFGFGFFVSIFLRPFFGAALTLAVLARVSVGVLEIESFSGRFPGILLTSVPTHTFVYFPAQYIKFVAAAGARPYARYGTRSLAGGALEKRFPDHALAYAIRF